MGAMRNTSIINMKYKLESWRFELTFFRVLYGKKRLSGPSFTLYNVC